MNRFETELNRHWLIWHWDLMFINRHGSVEHIASGCNLRKSKALLAAQSWQRVWLRKNGLLNP